MFPPLVDTKIAISHLEVHGLKFSGFNAEGRLFLQHMARAYQEDKLKLCIQRRKLCIIIKGQAPVIVSLTSLHYLTIEALEMLLDREDEMMIRREANGELWFVTQSYSLAHPHQTLVSV